MFWKRSAALLVILFVSQVHCETPTNNMSGYNLNTTTNIDDYIIQNKRQYASDIKTLEKELDEFKGSYKSRIGTVAVQSDLIEMRLKEIEDRMNPMELVDELSKHCVQKYRSQMATIAAVRQKMVACTEQGSTTLPSLIALLERTLNNLRQYHNTHLPSYLVSCRQKYPSSQQNYTICIMEKIRTGNEVTADSLNTFSNQLSQATCTAGFHIKEALDCSFRVVYSNVAQIGGTMQLIENCIQGKEFCAPCATTQQPLYPQIQNTCHQVNVTAKGFNRTNDSVEFPLAALNTTIGQCIQLNIV